MRVFTPSLFPWFLARAVAMVPAMVLIASHFDPSRALVLSQVALSFGIPFAMIPLVLFTRDRGLMGSLANSRLTNYAAYAVAAMIIGLNVFLLYQTIFRSAYAQPMKLGVSIGYWGLGLTAADQLEIAQTAEELGYDSIWTAEAYGSDAATVLAWLAAGTKKIKLGSGIFQIPARSAAMTAMTAATIDNLSGGRMLLGLGTSGP